MTEWAVCREIMNERKTQNIILGNDDPIPPEASTLLPKFMDRWYFKNPRSRVNNPELNQKFERVGRSIDIAEIPKLMSEIHRWAYEQYSLIPICEIPDEIATTQRIPKWNPGRRRSDRNYYEIIRQR